MLTETCQALRNWFDDDGFGGKNHIFGEFTIKDGTIDIDGIQDGQYFCIRESVHNDGVHKYPPSDLTDETFTGAIWLMKVPPDVIKADADFDTWKTEHADIINSPLQSENMLSVYSYTKATGDNGNDYSGTSIRKSPFWDSIKGYRKL